jgi:hypothetical protein
VAEASDHAARWAAPHAEAAIDWVTPRAKAAWHHGVAAAAPRVEEAARLLSPKIDIARDKLKDEVLPAIVEAVNRAAEVAAQSAGQAAAAPAIASASLAQMAKPAKKKHRVWRFIGWSSLAALAGAIAYAIWTRREPDSDPWSEDDVWAEDAVTFVPTTQGPGEAEGSGLASAAKDGLEDLAEAAETAADAVGTKTGEAVRKVSTAGKKAAAAAQAAIDKAKHAADAGAEEPKETAS